MSSSINDPLTTQLIGKQVPMPPKTFGTARVDGLPCVYSVSENPQAAYAEVIRTNGSRITLRGLTDTAVDPDQLISFRLTD
ncbi:MAG: hypothetical protein ABF651_04840 [Sporolactobacillus sp.]